MKRILTSAVALAVIGLAAPLATTAADAQQYPTRPVRLLVPIPAGGAPDIAARVIADKLTEPLGQPVVVENRPGANGNVASEAVVAAQPDGHTLILNADSQIVINPHLYKTMSFDSRKDLLLVATVASNDFVLSVNPKLPVTSFKEFIEYAKKTNPPLHYASGGNGSQHQMMMEMLKQHAGINLIHVPYRGGAPATTATVQGEVAAMFSGSSSAPMIKAGQLRALASTGAKRTTVFPDLPTIGEFYPGYQNSIWLAVFTTKGTPMAVVNRLQGEINKVLAQADTKDKLNRAGGLEPFITEGRSFEKKIDEDFEKFGKLVKSVGISVD